jgi:hypothetical protein
MFIKKTLKTDPKTGKPYCAYHLTVERNGLSSHTKLSLSTEQERAQVPIVRNVK